jgi:hypothetical protein
MSATHRIDMIEILCSARKQKRWQVPRRFQAAQARHPQVPCHTVIRGLEGSGETLALES